jgi:hypothetical protein
MNKFLPVLLATVLLVVAFLPAAASPPEPVDYRVVQGSSCWLPDASTTPVMVGGVKQNFYWVTPLRLVAFCRGRLPLGAELPKAPLELNYGSTDRLCRIVMGQIQYATSDYTATVMPDGNVAITCRVDAE